jgi:hypothetical protein
VVELVDTQVSEACAAMHASSSLASGTILTMNELAKYLRVRPPKAMPREIGDACFALI